MGMLPFRCCCNPSPLRLWGPFKERSSAESHASVDYYYASPLTWQADEDVDVDDSWTLHEWKVDHVDTTGDILDHWCSLTLAPMASDVIFYDINSSTAPLVENTGELRIAQVDADAKSEEWTQNLTSLTEPGGGRPADFVYESTWSTWQLRFYRSVANVHYATGALPLLNQGTHASTVWLTCQYTDQWACNGTTLVLFQFVWLTGLAEDFSLLTTCTSTGAVLDQYDYNPSDYADQLIVDVAAPDTTSPTTPSRPARLQVLCPRTYPDAFGVRPPVRWVFEETAATYTVHESVEVVFGAQDTSLHGFISETGITSVFSRSRTRTAYNNADSWRLNASVLYGDSNEDGDWACVYYWGEEELTVSGTYSSHTAKVVIDTSAGEYDSHDLAVGEKPEEVWSDIHMIRDSGGNRLAVGFEWIGTMSTGQGFWRMHCIDLSDASQEWTVDSVSGVGGGAAATFWANRNNVPYVIGSNKSEIHVAFFPVTSLSPVANTFDHAGNWLRGIFGFDDGVLVEWEWENPWEIFGSKMDVVQDVGVFD